MSNYQDNPDEDDRKPAATTRTRENEEDEENNDNAGDDDDHQNKNDGLCEYERLRLANIQRNEERLSDLGLLINKGGIKENSGSIQLKKKRNKKRSIDTNAVPLEPARTYLSRSCKNNDEDNLFEQIDTTLTDLFQTYKVPADDGCGNRKEYLPMFEPFVDDDMVSINSCGSATFREKFFTFSKDMNALFAKFNFRACSKGTIDDDVGMRTKYGYTFGCNVFDDYDPNYDEDERMTESVSEDAPAAPVVVPGDLPPVFDLPINYEEDERMTESVFEDAPNAPLVAHGVIPPVFESPLNQDIVPIEPSLSKQQVLALNLRGEYITSNNEYTVALEPGNYPDGLYKKIFRSPEDIHKTVLDGDYLEAISNDVNKNGTPFAKRTWHHLRRLPDVRNLFLQSVFHQSYKVRTLHPIATIINWSNFLIYIEEEVPLLAEFATSTITWIQKYKDDHQNRNPSFTDLVSFHGTLCNDPKFRVHGQQMIYPVKDIEDRAKKRGSMFENDFFTYSFYLEGHIDNQHNGKVFGRSMFDYMDSNIKMERWRKMLPIQLKESTSEQIRPKKRGLVYDLYQGAHDLNRNLYAKDKERSHYSYLNLIGHNLIEVFFVLINSGLNSMDKQPGNGCYGDAVRNSIDVDLFESWFVLYQKFLEENHHRPMGGPVGVPIDHFYFKHPQEKRISEYYQRRKSPIHLRLWTPLRKARVKTMIRLSLPERDPFDQDIAPNNICRFCFQRFNKHSHWASHQKTCYFDLTDEEAQLFINLAVENTKFVGIELISRIGWTDMSKIHWTKFEIAYRRYNASWAVHPYRGIYDQKKCSVWLRKIGNNWKGHGYKEGDDRNISKERFDELTMKIDEKRQDEIVSRTPAISSLNMFCKK